MRVPVMVTRGVREAVGEGYPVWYRFSQWRVDDDDTPLPYPDPEHLGRFLTTLREAGVDVFHASVRDMTEAAFDGSDATLAGWTRKLSGVPTVAVGGATQGAWEPGGDATLSDPAPMAELVDGGEADLVAVGRALIANPDWCEIVAEGRWRELRPYDAGMLESLADAFD